MSTSVDGIINLPSQAPRSLPHLPKELLHMVASNLDIPSALALLATSKQLSEPAESRIWSDVNLTLPDHHGEHPLIRPYVYNTDKYCHWAQAEARAAENRARDDLKERVEGIITVGNKRRFEYVKKLEIMDRMGSATASAQLLSLVRKRLQTLVVRPPLAHIWDNSWSPKYHETFYSKLHDPGGASPFQLPALTTLDITFSARGEYLDSLFILFAAARQLRHLKLIIPAPFDDTLDDDDEEDEQQVRGQPRTQWDHTNVYLDHLETLELDWEAGGTFPHSLELLLCQSSSLKSVAIKGNIEFSAEGEMDKIQLYSHLIEGRLEHLSWTGRDMGLVISSLQDHTTDNDIYTPFECLESLVLQDMLHRREPRIEFIPLPRSNKLARLHILSSNHNADVAINTTPVPSISVHPFANSVGVLQPLPYGLAHWLRNYVCELEHIQYVNPKDSHLRTSSALWSHKGIQGAIIRSFIHEDDFDDSEDSLLHIRVHSRWIAEDYYNATYPPPSPGKVSPRTKRYPEDSEAQWKPFDISDIEDGDTPPTTFVLVAEHEWTDMTDYRGFTVPFDIMTKMQRASNLLSKGDVTKGRNISVNGKGWKVLQDWYEAKVKEKNDGDFDKAKAAGENEAPKPPGAQTPQPHVDAEVNQQ